ncbi:MAG: hypothetical protein OES13_00265 [Acidimicrobiia bacterium]|nr:hypothetical protein [Acidimicrobiia bacterium]
MQIQLASILKMDGVLKPGVVFHHSPNETAMGARWVTKLLRSGMQTGWPDFEFVDNFADIYSCARFSALELKMPGGSLSKAQRATRDRLKATDANWHCARSIPDALETLQEWGLVRRDVEWFEL